MDKHFLLGLARNEFRQDGRTLVGRSFYVPEIDLSLYTIMQILSVTLFQKIPILQALTELNHKNDLDHYLKQLHLFNF